MSDGCVHDYGISLRANGKIEIFPAARVEFLNHEGDWISFFLVVDSGAAVTALPRIDGEALGMDVRRGVPVEVGGVSGESINGWRHKATVRFGGFKLEVPLVFLDSDSAPRVLGRAGVFERFSIVVEERRRKTAFLEERSRSALRVAKVVDNQPTTS